MKWYAQVSELGVFSGLGVSLARLWGATFVLLGLGVAYGRVVGSFVLEASRSPLLNIALIAGQLVWVVLGAYLLALSLASLLFGEAWRIRVIVGAGRPAPASHDDVGGALDEDAEEALAPIRDHSAAVYALFGVSMVLVYLGIQALTSRYIAEYQAAGYYLTELRSESAEARIRGLRGIHHPMQAQAPRHPRVQARVVELVSDPAAEVQAWAIWSAGKLGYGAAVDAILPLLDASEVEVAVEAAHALGRLEDPLAERAMIERLPRALGDGPRLRGLVLGLGLGRTREGIGALSALLGVVDAETEVLVLWAMTRSWSSDARDAVLERWASSTEASARCALAEAIKFVVGEADAAWVRTGTRGLPRDHYCTSVVWRDRSWDATRQSAPLVLVHGEELQTKFLKAAFNAAGPGLLAWLEDVELDPTYADEARILAGHMIRTLRQRGIR